ncbi:MAG: hypothetical protein ACK53F_00830 [Betaproteobacteria bacterium]
MNSSRISRLLANRWTAWVIAGLTILVAYALGGWSQWLRWFVLLAGGHWFADGVSRVLLLFPRQADLRMTLLASVVASVIGA